jgi:cytochrome c
VLSRCLCIVACLMAWLVGPALAQLRGHGGPVRALAVSPDGARLVSASFDTTVIAWSLTSGTAEKVLRFHQGAVNAVVFLPDGRFATSGEDRRIGIWQPGADRPTAVLEGHTAPVVALAVSLDGKTLASASWDNTVRLWPLAGGEARVLEGHQQNVNGVAFTQDGRSVVSASYDLTLRIWPVSDTSTPKIVTLPTPLNTVAVAANGDIITAGASGSVYILTPEGTQQEAVEAAAVPIIALAVSVDSRLVAASSVRGAVAIIDRASGKLLRTLVGPGLPAWSVAFLPDSATVLTGGSDRLIRRWNAMTGAHLGEVAIADPSDPLARYAGDHGAEVYRACVACHTLNPNEGPRAGPTLAGIFGRKIASLPGYDFSPALKDMEIIWTPETVSKLFEVGPAAYTPGTKMPEQRVGTEDRKALVEFLKKATRP